MSGKLSEERLGTERMLPLVFRMALPSVVAQVVNLLYSVVDRVFIGHIPDVGTDALAGIGVTGSVIILITAFSAIIGIGGAPLASIALGRGDRDRAKYILGNSFVLLLVFAVVTGLVTYAWMEPILLFTGASENTLPYAQKYLTIYLCGTLFVLIATGLNSFISAQGRPAMAMWAVVIGAFINIVLDYIFIFEMDMGVRGAALASVISQGVSAVWVLAFLFSKGASLPLVKGFMKINWGVVGAILALGVSPFIMASTEALIGFVLNGSLKLYGDIHISAMTILQSALLFVGIPLTGFAQGFVPIVSYNYGHGNMDRVKECFRIVVIIMTAFNFISIVMMMIFPEIVASAFTNDAELIGTVRWVLPVFFLGMTIFGLQRACQNMFVALGEAKISIFIALLRKVFLLIPLALILPKFMGVMGIYWAEAISDGLAASCCIVIFIITFPRILKRGAELAKMGK